MKHIHAFVVSIRAPGVEMGVVLCYVADDTLKNCKYKEGI